jgi:hypothetical protein
MTTAALGLVLPAAILFWGFGRRDRTPRGTWEIVFTLGEAMVCSAGLTSCLWFAWLEIVGMAGLGYVAVEGLVLLATAAALRRLDATEASGSPSSAPEFGGSAVIGKVPVTRGAIAVLGVLTLAWIVSFICNNSVRPHGSWDAVSTWNLDARFLASGSERWQAFIRHGDLCAYHGDYPLLLPSTVARLWSLTGSIEPAVGALVAFWFAAAAILLCGGGVGCMRGTTQGLLAIVALLGTGDFVEQSSTQYADIPLAAYMLAAAVALGLAEERRHSSTRWLLVAGATAGFAAWTKNEGIPFAVAVIALCIGRAMRHADVSGRVRPVVPLLTGLALPLLLLIHFKRGLAPENDLLSEQTVSAALARLSSVGRYLTATAGIIEAMVGMAKGLLFALPLYLAVMGRTESTRGKAAARSTLVIYAIMLTVYCGVYLTTPRPLEWQLETSARRLLLQLWPGVLFAYFLRVAAPEERFGASLPTAAVADPDSIRMA